MQPHDPAAFPGRRGDTDPTVFSPPAELDLAAMRQAYATPVADVLDEAAVAQGWPTLLQLWLEEAADFVGPDGNRVAEPNAMVLATVDEHGYPQSRAVLCKGVDERGARFFTNYDSDKGRALAAVPRASVTFPWFAMHRQVHLRGPVERLGTEETREYWRSRPRGARLGAWASAQSRPIGSRAELEAKLAEVTERFAEVDDIPVPPRWGGLLLRPEMVEFWQGQADRLHNRIRVTWHGAGWQVARLQP